MIDPEELRWFCCPQTAGPLRIAEPALIERLNRAIAAGELRTRAGEPVSKPLDGALVSDSAALVYPVVDDIPVLLVDEAIPLA